MSACRLNCHHDASNSGRFTTHHYYFWPHYQQQYLHWLQYTISSETWGERKRLRANFKGRVWTLYHTERDREDPCVLSFRTCVFNDNYNAAWRHLWFVMQIRKGHGENTMGCICWQENKLELANKSFVQRNIPQQQLFSRRGSILWVSTQMSFRLNIKFFYITTGRSEGLS